MAEHEGDVLRVCRSVLRDEHLGRDAAQDAFVRLWRALADGRAPERAHAWLRRAALSAALDLQRRRGARPGEASGEEEGVLVQHLEACAGCRELERELAGTLGALRPAGRATEQLPEEWRARLERRVGAERGRRARRVAAVFAAGIAAGVVAMALVKGGSRSEAGRSARFGA